MRFIGAASQCLGRGETYVPAWVFNLYADSGVNTWLEQPAALPPSWLVVPSAQQFVPGALLFAHVDHLIPLPTSS